METTSTGDLAILTALALRTAPAVAERFGDGRTGGFLYLCEPDGRMVCHLRLGIPDPNKWDKYVAFSAEKAQRLGENPNHLLSWQSRNPEENKWGGAILLPDKRRLSFSGFPEKTDEAYCASLAKCMEWMTTHAVHMAMPISGNWVHYAEVHLLVSRHAVGG